MSVLDLPLERQIEIAAEDGMTHEAWVIHQHTLTAEFAAYNESIKNAPPSKLWANLEFQKRVNGEAGIYD